MRIAGFSLIVAWSIFTIASSQGQEAQGIAPWEVKKTFDVGVGKVRILHSDELSGAQIINCRFRIEDFRTSPDTYASVALILTSSDPQHYDARSNMARLAAYRFEKDDGWRYEFTLTAPDDRDSRIVAYTGTTDLVLPMWLIKAEYPKVTYVVGKTDIDVSRIDVSNHPLASWQIVAIGVKGESRCSFES